MASTGNQVIDAIVQRNGITTAHSRIHRFNQPQIAVGEECCTGVVSGDRVSAVLSCDLVIPCSSNDGVCAIEECDGVRDAERELSAGDIKQFSGVRQCDCTVIAEYNAASRRVESIDGDRIR